MSSKCTDTYLVGLHGWRRKCLLFTLCLLLVVVVVNLTLTLWMLKVLHLSSRGMGALKIRPGEIQLQSETMVLDKLIATKVRSSKGKSIQVESVKNLSLVTTSSEGRVNSRVYLGDDRFDMTASSVRIADVGGKQIFSTDKREVLIGADYVHISGEGGTVVHGSVQTPLVRPEAGQNLTLESPTRSLNVFALHGVNLESRAGDISAHSHAEFKLQSKSGAVKLDAPNILLPKLHSLTTGKSSSSRQTLSRSGPKPEVFQLCLCGKGRLFLAPPEGPCVADNDVCR